MLSHRSLPVKPASRLAVSLCFVEIPCKSEKEPDVGIAMSFLASFMNLAGPDLIVILLIVLVLFGAKKLPELARGMGQAVKEFQKAKDEFNDELHKAGKSEADIAKADVKAPQATIARSENQAAASITPPEASAAVTPGDKADQV
jgi:sec-independent protein translocase protein TatA